MIYVVMMGEPECDELVCGGYTDLEQAKAHARELLSYGAYVWIYALQGKVYDIIDEF